MALSESPNPNEAGLALKRAQELMQKYGISKVDLTFADIAVKAKKAGNFKSVPAEIDILASTVKQLFQCEAFFFAEGGRLRPLVRIYGEIYRFQPKPGDRGLHF